MKSFLASTLLVDRHSASSPSINRIILKSLLNQGLGGLALVVASISLMTTTARPEGLAQKGFNQRLSEYGIESNRSRLGIDRSSYLNPITAKIPTTTSAVWGGTGTFKMLETFTGAAQQHSGLEIIFVDSAVKDIAAYLPKRSSHRVVHELHSQNPLAEMAQVLRSYHDVQAIHIISHGQTGQLILGGHDYDAATLKNYQSELKLIGQALQPGGDVLLYGCNIGKMPTLIATLAQLTGVDIAASNNPTGDTAQGGDWQLEVATGAIETAAIAAPQWQGLLWTTPAVETVGWFGDSPSLTPNATILAPGPFSSAGANIGAPSHTFSIVQVSVPALASVQKLQNVAATTFAQAQTNNDYFYSDLTVGSRGLLITMQYNQVSSTYNSATAKMGVSITDITSGGSEIVLNNTGVNLQGTSVLLNVPLSSAGTQLLPNRTYRVKFYTWGCGATQTCYVDNPKFFTQLNESPTANNVTATSQTNPGGTTKVQVPALNGTDPEDGTLGTGKSFRIVTLPTNGTLYYNGVAVTADQVISSYDSTLLTLDPTATGADTVSFTYKAIDSLTAESSAATVTMPFTASISGTVFEDPNYGGGVGRPLSTASTSPRDGVTVELYNSSGTYISSTTTSGGGKYSFINVVAGDYKVRVVNSTVTSSRLGYVTGLLPVQTFRTDASVIAGTVTPVTDRVGGEKPAEIDAPANTTATLATLNAVANQEVQSLTTVKVGSSNVSGIDFGYNFDTIVNTNDSGQGSLRQFVTNSNALGNTGLNQEANPSPASGTTAIDPAAGVETSIFMIPAAALNASGVAVITPTTTVTVTPPNTTASGSIVTAFPIITDANTAIDGRTQTINIGNTNTAANLGDKMTIVGVGGSVLPGVPSPEVELAGSSSTIQDFLLVNGNNTTIRNLAISATSTAGPIGVLGTIRILQNGTNTKILENAIGVVSATNSGPGGGYYASVFNEANNVTVSGNLLRGTGETVYNRESITGWTITNNEISTSVATGNSGNACVNFSNGGNTVGPQNALIQNNLMHNCAWGIQADSSNGLAAQILGNTIKNNTNSGILINFTEKNHLIKNNIITGNGSGGVVVERDVTGVTISQNSIFGNTGPGIDLSSNQASYMAQGITPNDGKNNASSGVTKRGNNGMDYPIITSSRLNSGVLTVSGFVGNISAGSITFANSDLEFFITNNTPADQNGEIIAGDGKSKSHGEGETYLPPDGGTCQTDANSKFTCTFSTAGTLGLTDPKNITATATDSSGNTSEFSAIPNTNANLLLVKRITAINGTPINTYKDDTTSPRAADDNHANWPTTPANTGPGDTTISSFLRGAIDAGKVKPGDEIEYTIYFLNGGENNGRSARICDRLLPNQTFKTSTYGTNQDLELLLGGSAAQYLTSNNDTADRAQLISANGTVPNDCNLKGANTNGTLVIDLTGSPGIPTLTTLPGSTGAGTNSSYGYIRFTTKVNP